MSEVDMMMDAVLVEREYDEYGRIG